MDFTDEKYKKYIGKQYREFGQGTIYTVDVHNDCVYIYYIMYGITLQIFELGAAFMCIENGSWVLYLNEERKQKLKKLMK